MDYVIRNDKGVYIRLNQNGAPVTCAEHDKCLFEELKAKNVLNGLPKTLKRLRFKIEGVPDIKPKASLKDHAEKKVIECEGYVVSDQIKQWIEKFGICDDILKEAEKRREELNRLLSNVDKEFSNIVHKIELEGKIDMYSAWKERIEVQKNRQNRRKIKDELFVISGVLKMDFRNLDRSAIDKAVASLAKRKFTYRMIEEDETEGVV